MWVPAVREEALAYGPDWRTLVLQDRGQWDAKNSELFPVTKDIIAKLQGAQAGGVGAGAGGRQAVLRALLPPRRGCCPANALPRRAAPTLEVFFARQEAGTGIKPHTDYCNFIQTSHLGLHVPEGDCWIKARGGGGWVHAALVQPAAGP